MAQEIKPKRRLVVSYENLAEELQSELKIKYPDGFTDHMIRIDKSFNDFFYAVTLETDEISYLVKINVKIDGKIDDDKDYDDGDEIHDGSDDVLEIADDPEDD